MRCLLPLVGLMLACAFASVHAEKTVSVVARKI